MPEALTNFREMVAALLGVDIMERVDKNQQQATEMLVIGAGFPRTGTSSLKEALERLGLKSYHMKNAMSDDVSLWAKHGEARMNGEPGFYPEIINHLSSQGYTATVDNPNILHYTELMERYPKAKVILGIRPEKEEDGGDFYAKSVLNTIARFGPLLRRVPYKWFSTGKDMWILHEWHLTEHGSPLDPMTKLPTYKDLKDSYELWNQKVQETVPAENLLVFKPTDGWEPLCKFLSPVNESIERNCQQLLKDKVPYPHVNDTASLQALQNVFHWIALMVENAPMLLVFGCLVWWMVVKTNAEHPGPRRKRKVVRKQKQS